MKNYSILLCILIVSGCSIFKKNSKTTEESSLSVSEDLNSSSGISHIIKSDKQQLLYHQDSSEADYTFYLWPKGKADFNHGGQMSGEFDSIIMTGRLHHLTSTLNAMGVKNVDSTGKKDKTQLAIHSNLGKKRVEWSSTPHFYVLLIIILIICIAAYLFAKRWSLRKKLNL